MLLYYIEGGGRGSGGFSPGEILVEYVQICDMIWTNLDEKTLPTG